MHTTELLKDLASAKRSQEALATYLKATEHPKSTKFADCGSYMLLREYIETQAVRVMNANFCKCHLLCQACAVRRAAKSYARFRVRIDHVLKEHPEVMPALATITVKDGDDFPERWAHLRTNLLRMRKKSYDQRRAKNPSIIYEWAKVQGFVECFEVKIGKNSKVWHPHCHALVLISDYIDQRLFSDQWREITGDSFIVGITKVDQDDLEKSLFEVFKYITKFNELTPKQAVYLEESLRGTRLVNSGGLLRGIADGDIDEDDPEDPEFVGPFTEFIARWFGYRKGYHFEEAHPETIPPLYLDRS